MLKIRTRKYAKKLTPIAFLLFSFIGAWGVPIMKVFANSIES